MPDVLTTWRVNSMGKLLGIHGGLPSGVVAGKILNSSAGGFSENHRDVEKIAMFDEKRGQACLITQAGG